MKYAIPTISTKGRSDEINPHFGRAQFFAIWDEETDEIQVLENQSNHFGGKGLPAEFLNEHCDGIICSGIGVKAIDLCDQIGMKLYTGAHGSVEDTIEAFKAGKLKEATSSDGCTH